MPTPDQIRQQSEAAYNQWRDQWREHAKYHSKHKMLPLTDFENTGIGKAILCIANGYSFEENIEIIKANKDKVDIIACDKVLGHCLENGITPTYVVVCDANVSYEKYLEPWKDKVKDIILFANVCGATKWTDEKWKKIYFFANKDILHSELEFMQLSGCKNAIPASTNVSNTMVVLLTQSDNHGRCNFFGYDKILLIGYDYSWRPDGKYYAFDEDGGGKYNYMRHMYVVNNNDVDLYSSGNLSFSAQWLHKYITTFKLPIIQCSKNSLLNITSGDLEKQMNYCFRPEDASIVRRLVLQRNAYVAETAKIDEQLRKIGRDHFLSANGTL